MGTNEPPYMPPPGDPSMPPPGQPGAQFPGAPGNPPQFPGTSPPQFPPAAPGYPPQAPGYPPTQQMPPTQMAPQYPPAGYPPTQAFPGYGGVPGAPVPAPKKKKTGLIIGGGLVAAALVAGGVILLTGGDDDTTTVAGSSTTVATSANVSTTVALTTATTLGGATTTVVLTLPPTTPPTVAPGTTAPGGTFEGFVSLTDDLGAFSVQVPEFLEVDTSPVTSGDGATLPAITAASSVDGFYSDDVTFGYTFFAIPAAVTESPEDVLNFLTPGDGVCASSQTNIGYPTAFGGATMVTFDGCGDGSAAKVIFVLKLPDRPAIIALYLQGAGTSADLVDIAQFEFETMRPV